MINNNQITKPTPIYVCPIIMNIVQSFERKKTVESDYEEPEIDQLNYERSKVDLIIKYSFQSNYRYLFKK